MKKILLLLILITQSKSFSQEPSIQLAAKIGAIGYDSAKDLKIDDNNNLYLTGGFQSSVDFDFSSNTFFMNGVSSSDAFLTKYNNNGDLLWGVNFSGNYNSCGLGIGVDSIGNVYSMGVFNDTVDFDPGPGTYNMSASLNPFVVSDIYITKLDSNGNFNSAHQISGVKVKDPTAFCVEANGNSIVAGYFNGVTNFSAATALYPTGSANYVYDMFIAKYGNSGLLWVKQIGSAAINQRPEDIVTDLNGNIYLCGQFLEVTDFDPSPTGTSILTPHSLGSTDIFVLKLDANGNFIWAKNCGGSAPNSARSIALDQSGNLYLTGYFTGTIDFDPSPFDYLVTSPSGSGYNTFVLKINNAGDFQWAKNFSGNSMGNKLIINPNGKIVVTGFFNNTCDFSGGLGNVVRTTTGRMESFLAELNSDGTTNWVKCFGGTGDDQGIDIGINSLGNYTLFGEFEVTANTTAPDNFTLTSNGSTDLFILKTENLLNIGNFEKQNFSISPNPCDNIINIIKTQDYDAGDLFIYSITGQLIKKIEISNTIEIKELTAGLYFLKLVNTLGNYKLIKFTKK